MCTETQQEMHRPHISQHQSSMFRSLLRMGELTPKLDGSDRRDCMKLIIMQVRMLNALGRKIYL